MIFEFTKLKNQKLVASLLIAVSIININPLYSLAQDIKFLSFDELEKLSVSQNQDSSIQKKVELILNTPIIKNNYTSANYTHKKHEKIGSFIRVAHWNIARGMNLEFIKNIFTDPSKLPITIDKEDYLKKVKEEIDVLRASDVLVLNEVDYGMPRTGYVNVAEEIAKAGKYNFTFAPEFIEIDPVHLGIEDYKWSEERFLKEAFNKTILIDKLKYKGLHGNAILSKFPLLKVDILRLPNYYDWYNAEKSKNSSIELARKNLAEKIFNEEIIREVRLGSRIALIADIKVPGIDEPLTVISVHLENRTIPENRKKQMKYLLSYIKNKKNPVILAGDLNTTMADGSPTKIEKIIYKKLTDVNFLGRTILLYGNPYGLAITTTTDATNFLRTTKNPAAISIPLLANNPERGLFKALMDMKFEDGYTFDFRGDDDKTLNKKDGLLANSNERTFRGFTPTYLFKKNFGVAKYKLDWIFVKSYLKNCKDEDGPNKFSPHFARTLFNLNYSLNTPISDHIPITVDIPMTEYSDGDDDSS